LLGRLLGVPVEGKALSILLNDDRLPARSEEAVWEAIVGWKGGAAGKVGWRGVVVNIRFPSIGKEYLRHQVVGMVGGEDGEWIAGVVAEALRAKAARREGASHCAVSESDSELEVQGRKAALDRVGLSVWWEENRDVASGELRLAGHVRDVTAIVACDGRICSGSDGGLIRVWSRPSAGHRASTSGPFRKVLIIRKV
jgi:hypothetical protein